MNIPAKVRPLGRSDAFWRKDFSTVPADSRRAARHALQMVARCPFLHPRLADEDFLGALWMLALPLVDPNALARRQAFWQRPDTRPGEDDGDGGSPPTHRRKHLGLNVHPLPGGVPGARMRAELEKLFRKLPDTLLRRLAAADGRAPTNEAIAVLAQTAGLDDVETAILDFVDKKIHTAGFRELLREACNSRTRDHYACLSAALDVPMRELKPRLRRSASLYMLQLVRSRAPDCDLEDFLRSEDLLDDILMQEPASADALLACIVEPVPAVQCRPGDFPHLVKDARRLQAVLGSALQQGERGVNALLYGPPGTGKTQFALVVATAAGLTPIMIKTADKDGDGLSRTGRLGAYQLTQRLLRGRRDCVIVFDEVEDVFHSAENALLALFGGEAHAGNEKGWMNRSLEENPVPAIWITNNAAGMDRAFLRRFLLPVSFATPPRAVRRQIAARHLGEHALPQALIEELAADDALLPAHFDAARRLLGLQGDADPVAVVREGLSASRRLLHGSPLPLARTPAVRFDIAYLNLAGGIAPARLADALAHNGRGSLCFYGPPGTGKTEFAHVLAGALGRELVARSTADLLSPYIGETERKLAGLFAQIDVERSILFLDEIDSLLRDRRRSRHSWETTQVNELLQRMERFPGIFIAATNLAGQLDPAALRRFDFKLHFRPLDPTQRCALFAREALGDESHAEALPPAIRRTLDGLETLTPGDFANVSRQRELLGETLSAQDCLRRLVVECRWKQQGEALA